MPKVRGLLMPVLTHNLALDALTLAVLVGVLALLAWRRRLEVRPGLATGAAILLGLFLVLPGEVFDTTFAAERLPIAAVLILLAAVRPCGLSRRAGVAVAAVVLALVLARAAVLAENWSESGRYYERLRVMAQRIEPGSSVLLVSPGKGELWQHRFGRSYPDWHYALINVPNLHMIPMLPLAQRATFTPGHFTHPDKQILSVREPWRAFDYVHGSLPEHPTAVFRCAPDGTLRLKPRWTAFDYLLVLYADHLAPEQRARLQALRPLYESEDLMLLQVDRLPLAPASPEPSEEERESCL